MLSYTSFLRDILPLRVAGEFKVELYRVGNLGDLDRMRRVMMRRVGGGHESAVFSRYCRLKTVLQRGICCSVLENENPAGAGFSFGSCDGVVY